MGFILFKILNRFRVDSKYPHSGWNYLTQGFRARYQLIDQICDLCRLFGLFYTFVLLVTCVGNVYKKLCKNIKVLFPEGQLCIPTKWTTY